jgi:acyl-CoA thioester hydrolase
MPGRIDLERPVTGTGAATGQTRDMRVDLDISSDPAAYPFRHGVRVRFAETDAMGVLHHAAYVPYLEEARVEYLRALGHPYPSIRAEGYDLAVLELVTQYRRSARFDEVVTVHTRVSSFRGASFQIDYLLTVDDEVCALAATVHGVVDANSRATRAPGWMKDLLTTTT